MSDLLQRGAEWLGGMFRQHAARPVVYRRGDESASVLATVGRTLFELADAAGEQVQYESRDYLIAAADLVLDGSQVEPQRGDRIEEVLGGQTLTYEVMAPGQEPPWRYSDPYRTTLRIHTKLIDSA